MFYFSTNEAAQRGFTEVQQHQFNALSLIRQQSAQAAADFILSAKNREPVAGVNAANAADDIRRLYKAQDQMVTKEFKSSTEFTLLSDLMPLARSVKISQSVYEYARTGGDGAAHTSMSGQIGAMLNATTYSFDGTMVPVHDTGFKFNWRDPIFESGSALQTLADAQQNSIEIVRRKYVDYMFNGFRDAAGNYVTFDEKTWKGLKNDERVQKVDLTFNFATNQDPVEIRQQVRALRDALRIANKQSGEQTWYVSSDIYSNFENYFDQNNYSRTILEEVKRLGGIKDVKIDDQLTGNEILIVVLNPSLIAPIVGQPFATTVDPRLQFNSDYVWRTWGAAGLMVKTDINNSHSVLFASGGNKYEESKSFVQ